MKDWQVKALKRALKLEPARQGEAYRLRVVADFLVEKGVVQSGVAIEGVIEQLRRSFLSSLDARAAAVRRVLAARTLKELKESEVDVFRR